MPGQDATQEYDLLGRLVEELNNRPFHPEVPAVAEYSRLYPHLADAFQDLVSPNTPADDDEPADTPAPAVARMGDFHILREVGRGGMGVVYEAEQTSLGRRVALKVLTQKLLRDGKQRRRFEREAKAAARLHHTNIVPVHGYGEHDAAPYYVMQFIRGMGLDAVVEELARLTPSGPHRAWRQAQAPTPTRPAASVIARSLLSGAFRPRASDTPVPAPVAAAGLADPPPNASAVSVDRAAETLASAASVTLAGRSAAGRRPLSYWQSVARVGAQVADALAYAHGQGVVHRDIKPSNLLLDLNGTVWVTDFGLAKADGSEDLTLTGDVLGTLRYMPPEAFDGKADGRGDVYALGLTLYELVALRPAFGERDRHKLIRQVTAEAPAPLGRVRKGVPRDLETIITKATDRDPARRYQSAAEFRDDLRRFAADEPIKARRQSRRESARRWARRNPAVAALAGCVALLLVGITAASVKAAADFEKAAADERRSKDEAVAAKQQAEASYARARRAVDESFTQVSESDLLKVPGLQPLRAKLLKSAVGFYEDFLAERAGDPGLKADRAAVQARLARVFTELGRAKEARAALDAAVAGYTEAAAANPADLALAAGLADAWAAHGELYFMLSHTDPDQAEYMAESLKGYQTAAELGERVVAGRPGNLDDQASLARALNGVGLGLWYTDPAGSVAAFRRCLELREVLLRVRPDDPALAHAVGESLNNIATFLTGPDQKAERVATQALAVGFNERAFRLRPASVEYGLDLAVGYQNLARSGGPGGDPRAAAAGHQKAVAQLETVAKDHPFSADIQRRRFGAYLSLAAAWKASGQPAEAEAAVRQAIDGLARLPAGTADELAGAAALRAACARNDLAPADKDRLAGLAVEALKAAAAAGLADAAQVTNDPNLKALTDRADLKDVLATIAANGKGGATPAAADPRPAVAAGHLALARIQADFRKLPEARESLGRVVALRQALAAERPNDKPAAAEVVATEVLRGDVEWAAGGWPEAVAAWRAGVDALAAAAVADPGDDALRQRLAEVAVQVGERFAARALWAEAAACFDRATAAGHPDPWVRARGGQCHWAAGDGANYRRVCQQVWQRFADGGNVEGLAAVLVLHAHDPEAAPDPDRLLALAERVHQARPQSWWRLMPAVWEARGPRPEAALRWADDPSTTAPEVGSAFAAAAVAVAHRRQGHPAEARRWLAVTRDLAAARLRAFDGRDPLGEMSWTGLVEHRAAHRWAAKVVTGADLPADPREHLYRGRVYARLGDAAKADAEFAAAVAARPDDPEVFALRAAILDDLGQTDRATADRATADEVAGRVRAAGPADAATAAGLAAHTVAAFDRSAWTVVKPVEAKSEGGATLTVRPDGSVLACGPSPEWDVYTATFDAPAGPVTGLRLECLPDPSLPFGRSGRQPRFGSFDLSGLTAEVDGKPVRITSAAADGSAPGTAPGAVLDGKPDTYWCPPTPGDRHWLAVAFAEPLSAGGRVTVRIECRNPKYRRATLGRFRLAVTGVPLDRLAALKAATTVGGWGRLAAAEVLIGGDPGATAEHLARALDEATPAAARMLARLRPVPAGP